MYLTVAIVAYGHIDKDWRLVYDFTHMGKKIQINAGCLDSAELLGASDPGFGYYGNQIGFPECLDVQAHGGHGQIELLRKLTDGHGFGDQAPQDLKPGFGGQGFADVGRVLDVGQIECDLLFYFVIIQVLCLPSRIDAVRVHINFGRERFVPCITEIIGWKADKCKIVIHKNCIKIGDGIQNAYHLLK